MQHLAPAAENSKSVFFKGRPEARKWLGGEEGELFQLNGHKRKINPQPWKAPRGGREGGRGSERSREGVRYPRRAHWRGWMKQIHEEHGNPGRYCLQLNMNREKQASFIGNVKASRFISLALNLHWESAHGTGKKKKNHPSPKAAHCNRCLTGSCFK